jgi:hypothetical protein
MGLAKRKRRKKRIKRFIMDIRGKLILKRMYALPCSYADILSTFEHGNGGTRKA